MSRRKGKGETRGSRGDEVSVSLSTCGYFRPRGYLLGLIIFPAIDLRQGQVVRLRRATPRRRPCSGTIRPRSPPLGRTGRRVAARGQPGWAFSGQVGPHVRSVLRTSGGGGAQPQPGRSPQPPPSRRVRSTVGLPIQFGGGIRTVDDVARALAWRDAVVPGTVAVPQPQAAAQAVARFGVERIVVGIDARDGMVATHGWRRRRRSTRCRGAAHGRPGGAADRLHRHRRRRHPDRCQRGTTPAVARRAVSGLSPAAASAAWPTSVLWRLTPPTASRA